MSRTVQSVMMAAPVMPVLVIQDVRHAVPVAEALVAGGLGVLEVTLRTPAALEVIAAMRAVKGALVGAGTVLNARDLEAAQRAGAEFIVSPGLTENLARAAREAALPFLPGVQMRATSCAGSIWGSIISSSFPRKHLAASRL
jgi:2-dehydro-3-deoxyphosphogluconate aldolase/(4S)-4-hydroxy-2-oxoglutarate aldolase